jgi:hypothetical protein
MKPSGGVRRETNSKVLMRGLVERNSRRPFKHQFRLVQVSGGNLKANAWLEPQPWPPSRCPRGTNDAVVRSVVLIDERFFTSNLTAHAAGLRRRTQVQRRKVDTPRARAREIVAIERGRKSGTESLRA